MFPTARAAGAPTALLPASETPYDAEADFRATEPVAPLLAGLAAAVLAAPHP
jgi:hypothetical protein